MNLSSNVISSHALMKVKYRERLALLFKNVQKSKEVTVPVETPTNTDIRKQSRWAASNYEEKQHMVLTLHYKINNETLMLLIFYLMHEQV